MCTFAFDWIVSVCSFTPALRAADRCRQEGVDAGTVRADIESADGGEAVCATCCSDPNLALVCISSRRFSESVLVYRGHARLVDLNAMIETLGRRHFRTDWGRRRRRFSLRAVLAAT